jgi:hypothetical protein
MMVRKTPHSAIESSERDGRQFLSFFAVDQVVGGSFAASEHESQKNSARGQKGVSGSPSLTHPRFNIHLGKLSESVRAMPL